MTACTFDSRRAQAAIKRILGALATDPMTVDQLAAAAHLTTSSLYLYIPHLTGADRRIRITGYEMRRGVHAAIYGLGAEPDAKRPKPRTGKQRFKVLKADPEKYQRTLAQRRVLHLRAKLAVQPNTWFGALPGADKQEGAAC